MRYPNIRLFFQLLITIYLWLFQSSIAFSQVSENEISKAEVWADSVYQSLTFQEKIAQLFFARANQSGEPYIEEVGKYIKNYNIGGVVFFRADPISQALKTNEWNRLAKTPLFIAIDAEWGLGMRLSNTINYPLQMTLGAIESDTLLYQMGAEIAEQSKRMGIHINFAPVVDVNNNPANPVIGMRSFGEDPANVSLKAYHYMKGMQDHGLIACAKHFPGHGNTDVDSHVDLPVISASKNELKDVELVPFQYLIDKGVSAIMVAHLSVPALEHKKNVPSSLSEKIVDGYLKNKMGFEGLIIPDGLDMKGVTKHYKENEVALEAFMSGNDIMLIPENIPASIEAIKEAILKGKVSEERLEESCKKVLKYKYLSGVWKNIPVDTTRLLADLNQPEFTKTVEKLFGEAITVVRNNDDIIPLAYPDTLSPAVIIIGSEKETGFEETLAQFMPFKIFRLAHDADIDQRQAVLNGLEEYNLVIIAIINTNILATRNFNISDGDVQFIDHVARKKTVILDIFASPYALNAFGNTDIFEAIVISYQDKPYMQQASAEAITGMRKVVGKLSVSAGSYITGAGIMMKKTRLSYATPEELGINTSILKKIDSIALDGIAIKAFPGCQILAAKDGYIFYGKSFGYHTYDKKSAVKNDDIYDLASLTKILATTPAIMQMYDAGLIDINGKLSDYLLYLKGTNKSELGFREIMAHQAGLQSWIPYYENTILNTIWDTAVYRSSISETFPIRVADHMYIQEDYHYAIYNEIIQSPLEEKEYKYSDLGFYLFRDLIEQANNIEFDDYVYQHFYEPMGLKNLRFQPRKFFSLNRIIPTEFDQSFRHQLLQGDVHDQGAAMLGGISGHAGLFGNAHDVAVMMQMFLNEGNYGGRNFIDQKTVDLFTSYQFPDNDNRRGLGFDKPLLEFEAHRTNCRSASPSSYGHSGFTGTYTWADPETGLVYVFLSNRIYPDMNNTKLMELDIRTNIHQLFYEAIGEKAE